MAWAAAIGSVIEAVQRRQFRTADNRIEANRATEEYERQKEFAQMGIRWRAADAKAAGLHPLAALGSQTLSYSPQSVGVDSSRYLTDYSQMGQNIDRAINAKTTEQEREYEKLELSRFNQARTRQIELQNEKLERDLNNPTQTPPPMQMTNDPVERHYGIPGQGPALNQGGVVQPGTISNTGSNLSVQSYDPESNVIWSAPEIPTSQQPGISSGVRPYTDLVVMPSGAVRPMVRQDYAPDEQNWWVQMKAGAKDAWSDVKRWLGQYTQFPANEQVYEELRKERPSAPPGYEYRYNVREDGWMLRRGEWNWLFDGLNDIPAR